MTRRASRAWWGLLVLAMAVVVMLWVRPRLFPSPVATSGPSRWSGWPADTVGYARADGPRVLSFPADHGPHPDYQTEWWYYTGNLQAVDGRRLGFQLTFFRRALAGPRQGRHRASSWAADQIYMAHFALTDAGAGSFRAFERFSRGAAGLAGARNSPYRVWLQDWSVEEAPPNAVRLRASQGDMSLDLLLTDHAGPVLHGDRGYSRKGPQIGNASYYYSLTRLETTGTARMGETVQTVTGLSWMDHEFSTSALGSDQVGWDWFALQLDDGGALMVFQLRRADGRVDEFSSGTIVDADGRMRHLSRDGFRITALATWRSPRSGAVYPARWSVSVPTAGLTLDVEPLLADQELNVSLRYWEGAVRLTGARDGQAVAGSGYVELTGYAGSMQGRF